jgi:hypothetical protein
VVGAEIEQGRKKKKKNNNNNGNSPQTPPERKKPGPIIGWMKFLFSKLFATIFGLS